MKPISLFILSSCIAVLSCNPSGKPNGIDSTANSVAQSINTTTKDTSGTLTPDHFKNLPKEIAGCNCTFSGDEERYKAKEYLFAANNNKVAFISVNNNLIKLQQISTSLKEGDFGTGDHTDVYTNNNYKVTVEIKFVKSLAEEVWWNTGTLTIESKDGRKTITKFVGECGC